MDDNIAPPVLAGDYTDDDSQVIDSYFREATVDPQNYPRTAPTTTLDAPRDLGAARLLTSTLHLRSSFGAVQILPADPQRKRLYIIVQPETADYGVNVRLGDDPSKLYFDSSAMLQWPSPNMCWYDDYTGPLWAAVANVGTDSGMIISVGAVTR